MTQEPTTLPQRPSQSQGKVLQGSERQTGWPTSSGLIHSALIRTLPHADALSPEVFQIVLHNPTTAHRLLKFSQARMCGENMEFLEKVGVELPTPH